MDPRQRVPVGMPNAFSHEYTLADSIALPPPQIDWVLPGALPAGELGLLVGADGTGKSMLALLAAVAVADGSPWAGGLLTAPTTQGPVLYVSAEDGWDEITRRVHQIHSVHQIDHPDSIQVRTTDGRPFPLLMGGRQDSAPQETEALTALEHAIQATQPRLIIIDPLVRFARLNEADPGHMDALASTLISLARSVNAGCAVLAVHHAGQDAGRNTRDDQWVGRGSSALNAAARAVVVIRRPDQHETQEIIMAGEDPRRFRAVSGPKISRATDMPTGWVEFAGGVPRYTLPIWGGAAPHQKRGAGRRTGHLHTVRPTPVEEVPDDGEPIIDLG